MQTLFLLKRGTILFWALWFFFAWLTNVFSFLKHIDWLPITWAFASSNFALVESVLAIYQLPHLSADVLFLGVLGLEALITLLFLIAFFTFKNRHPLPLSWVNRAFTLSAALWALFLVTEEIFIAYMYEQTHLLLFVAQLICLMMISLLPHEKK